MGVFLTNWAAFVWLGVSFVLFHGPRLLGDLRPVGLILHFFEISHRPVSWGDVRCARCSTSLVGSAFFSWGDVRVVLDAPQCWSGLAARDEIVVAVVLCVRTAIAYESVCVCTRVC